jgi:hypothetical protein
MTDIELARALEDGKIDNADFKHFHHLHVACTPLPASGCGFWRCFGIWISDAAWRIGWRSLLSCWKKLFCSGTIHASGFSARRLENRGLTQT